MYESDDAQLGALHILCSPCCAYALTRWLSTFLPPAMPNGDTRYTGKHAHRLRDELHLVRDYCTSIWIDERILGTTDVFSLLYHVSLHSQHSYNTWTDKRFRTW